jgi:hypothetical protein
MMLTSISLSTKDYEYNTFYKWEDHILEKGTIHASGCHLFSEALSFYKPFCKFVAANLTSSDSLTFTNYS